ncbi:glycosyltransferase [Flavobacterium sp. MC2016-06]|jgi:glycosyltransferase involved in cell wall biosynthesis|uniref:glycosyltransferase n=1 Tax=Flavobacterium sp. MC2016-06 TaxID=2676308 RepID=UPI0012BACFF8|nr:glycosyltransferase [Flavobacterium sp. MC2016-06]MBU3858683.1 hypothetical protein [Flavobacterium sp. MC2016-06]
MSNIKRVYVFGLFNSFYDSFYIKGIQDLFGKDKIVYNLSKFPRFKQNTFAVIFEDGGGKETKMIIDSRDTDEIWNEELIWCDVYGKINYDLNKVPADFTSKIIPIGPSFGIKFWNLYETLFFGIKHTLKFKKRLSNPRDYFANYWRQYKRLQLEDYYSKEEILENYVFFVSSIWKKESQTNTNRFNYIKTCKDNSKIIFEGGFAPRKDGNNLGFDIFLISQRVNLKTYFSKTKKSEFVFNTPAVLSCHGWKLAEFLAMGKAIISTNHKNVLPSPLDNNVQVVYVDENSSQDYSDKINYLICNPDKRKELETNALIYFKMHLEPTAVITKLLNYKV